MSKITIKYCEGRKSPYQVAWSDNGIRNSRFFQTEEERAEFLAQKRFLTADAFTPNAAKTALKTGALWRLRILPEPIWSLKNRQFWKLWILCLQHFKWWGSLQWQPTAGQNRASNLPTKPN